MRGVYFCVVCVGAGKRARKKAICAIIKLTTDLTLAHGRGDSLLPSSLYVAHYTIRLSRFVMRIIDFCLRNLKIYSQEVFL